jgi:ethanolamine utilization cobalamin adenosyltransferase
LPAPKELHLANGKFVIKSTTTIVIRFAVDRTAAEMLQQEIYERSGIKPSIESVPAAVKTTGNISLERLPERGLESHRD